MLQTSAFSVPHIMIARFVTGIGTGIETSTVPMYQSELCEASKRGRLVASEPLFVGVGIVIAYWFDYGMSFVPGSIAWRLPIGCQIIFAVVRFFDSLAIQGRANECRLSSSLSLASLNLPAISMRTGDTKKHCRFSAMYTMARPMIPKSQKRIAKSLKR